MLLADTTSKYTPKPSGVQTKTALTQDELTELRWVQTINDERVVGTIKSAETTINEPIEDQAVSVGNQDDQAKG